MSTTSMRLPQQPWLRPKRVIFGVIGLMVLYVLYHNESFLVNHDDPVWTHYEPFKWWLLPHGIAGALALLLGPMQFSDRLRQRYLRLHRISGRVYVGGVLIAAPIGFYIESVLKGSPPSLVTATAVDATLWISTTVVALVFAMKGKIQQHRQWMTRSYAVAIVFLEVRVISGLMGLDQDMEAVTIVIWICLAFALLLADSVIQWQELRRPKPIAATARSGT
jgi:uncharacterized membrane protein